MPSTSSPQNSDGVSGTIHPVSVFLRTQSGREPRDRSLLRDAVSARMGIPTHEIEISSFCPQCRQTDHGRPVLGYCLAAHPAPITDRPELPQISLSRCDTLVAVALAAKGALGVDIETIEGVARADFDSVAFHENERAALLNLTEAERPLARTILWAAKEAILKAAGTGLTISPDLLLCELAGLRVRLLSWPSELGFLIAPEVTIARVDDHHVCAVAHTAGAATTFSWWPGDA